MESGYDNNNVRTFVGYLPSTFKQDRLLYIALLYKRLRHALEAEKAR